MATMDLTPCWPGMRAWLLNVARTDLATALSINAEMGSEAVPVEELRKAAGHND